MAKEKKVPKGKVKVLRNGRLKIFEAVKGLVKDGKLVRRLIGHESPDLVVLGLAPEELNGLRELLQSEEEYEPDLSNIDLAYVDHLSEYGEVEAPPPCFTRALIAVDEYGIDTVAIDLNVEVHTEIYVENVHFSDLLRQSLKFRSMKKKKFKIETPEEFALTWDAMLNKARGFSTVETARERCMADSLMEILDSEEYQKILAVIEIERSSGVIGFLEASSERDSPEDDHDE